MNEFLSGEKLYGDDFDLNQIKKWYEEEKEAYANLGSKKKTEYSYKYHKLNVLYGFNKIKTKEFKRALGIGAAWGEEFLPVIDRIKELTILEPSENLISEKLGNITPEYVPPEVDGKMNFSDNTFDLITCFGTLHHIPNVSFVLKEIIRVLKPGGYFLLREPINSMGDWSQSRNGLTKNERGIPVNVFDKVLSEQRVKTVSKIYCFTLTSLIQRKIGKYLKKPVFCYSAYLFFDRCISYLLKWNYKYHPTSKLRQIAPSAIYYVIMKN